MKFLPEEPILSTFLVHLTRFKDDKEPLDRLRQIILGDAIVPESPFGLAVSHFKKQNWKAETQDCVCFTETPLEHISLLTQDIEGRQIKFAPYGVVITKKQARGRGVNPVWYLDQTPGHDWLTKPVKALIEQSSASSDPIFRLTPFIEQFGGGGGWTKDFSWEREWRKAGPFFLPRKYMLICPEADHDSFAEILEQVKRAPNDVSMVDPAWGLEEIIARLAGYTASEIGSVTTN